MKNWEDAILNRQESEKDDCCNCPHKGIECRSQCDGLRVVVNPVVAQWLRKRGK